MKQREVKKKKTFFCKIISKYALPVSPYLFLYWRHVLCLYKCQSDAKIDSLMASDAGRVTIQSPCPSSLSHLGLSPSPELWHTTRTHKSTIPSCVSSSRTVLESKIHKYTIGLSVPLGKPWPLNCESGCVTSKCNPKYTHITNLPACDLSKHPVSFCKE